MIRLAAALLVLLSGCAPDAVPRTITLRADSSATPALVAVAADVEAAMPGLTVAIDTAGAADVVVLADRDRVAAIGSPVALVQSGLVVVGPPGAAPAPTLSAALSGARRVAVAPTEASGRLAEHMLRDAGLWDTLPLVRVASAAAALDSVAARRADVAFALAADALNANAYAVVYRLNDAEAPPAVVYGAVRTGAPPEAQALLDALAAPTAYRAWAAAGFRPPPR